MRSVRTRPSETRPAFCVAQHDGSVFGTTGVMTVFSDRLKAAMEERGVSQVELGEMLKVHRQAVHRWVVGEVEPKVLTAVAIADLLDVDVAWLTGQVERKGVPRRRK